MCHPWTTQSNSSVISVGHVQLVPEPKSLQEVRWLKTHGDTWGSHRKVWKGQSYALYENRSIPNRKEQPLDRLEYPLSFEKLAKTSCCDTIWLAGSVKCKSRHGLEFHDSLNQWLPTRRPWDDRKASIATSRCTQLCKWIKQSRHIKQHVYFLRMSLICSSWIK